VQAPANLTTTISYAGGMPLAQRRESAVGFFGFDPSHSDITFLTGEGGGIAGRRTYDPWGEVRHTSEMASYLGFQSDPTDHDHRLRGYGGTPLRPRRADESHPSNRDGCPMQRE
jgi:hypothetical protein